MYSNPWTATNFKGWKFIYLCIIHRMCRFGCLQDLQICLLMTTFCGDTSRARYT